MLMCVCVRVCACECEIVCVWCSVCVCVCVCVCACMFVCSTVSKTVCVWQMKSALTINQCNVSKYTKHLVGALNK